MRIHCERTCAVVLSGHVRCVRFSKPTLTWTKKVKTISSSLHRSYRPFNSHHRHRRNSQYVKHRESTADDQKKVQICVERHRQSHRSLPLPRDSIWTTDGKQNIS